jgi:hypothetical protein
LFLGSNLALMVMRLLAIYMAPAQSALESFRRLSGASTRHAVERLEMDTLIRVADAIGDRSTTRPPQPIQLERKL